MRILAAFVVAPLVIPVLFIVLLAAGSGGQWPRQALLDFFFLFAGVTYVVALIFGVPAFLLYLRHGIRSWTEFAGGGAVIGLLAAVVLAIIVNPHAAGDALLGAALFMVSGVLSAILFRGIAYGAAKRATATDASTEGQT
jgi:hypothetical protein